ncbi:type II secretion system F family protein [Arenibaculum sp.]|jgi:general secretion pathway protein F|uniref:type II secretion system F family protein n=1 Tax=Arenibaculum sp. TaxID=2865862 RepID=UPI002E1223C0|nr:type II secretion system F family protein [Arenibaculum sp.]
MARYRYKAVGNDGEIVEGEMEAADRALASDRLRGAGHYPIRVEEIAAGSRESLLHRDLFGARPVKARQIAVITRELATLLGAGLPLDRAFTVLRGVSETGQVEKLLTGIQEKVRGGSSLADAMAAQGSVFPRYYVSMVRAGEAGGALELTLARLADLLEKAYALRESVKSALVYPAILLVFAGLSVILLLTLVLPQFEPLFEDAGEALPWGTRLFMSLGDAVERYGLVALAVAAAVPMVLRRLLADPGRRLLRDRMLLSVPMLGSLIALAETARFTRTMGTLLSNGVPILTALSIVQETVANRSIAVTLGRAQASLKSGGGLAAPLGAAGTIPPLAVHLIRVGEETGALDTMLTKIADIYDQEVGRSVQRLLALLVPALTVILGLVVAGIISSILVAILSVNELAL